jgi:cysteine-rich repeat protein
MGDSGAGGGMGGGMGGGAVAGSGGQGGGLQEDCYNGKGDLSSDVVDCASPACEDTCASLCVAPHPLFDNVTFAGSTKGHQNFFDPVCSSNQSTGPDVAFVYQTQSGGELTVMLDSGLDMVLSLRQTCGGGGADVRCSDAVAGGTEQASVVVEPGETWYVVVGGAVPGVEGPFSLTAHVTPAGCGNGKVDLGESCDDGNKDNTDACNTDCQFTACKATGLTDATAMEGFPVVSMKGQTSAGGASTIQPSCARLGSSAPDKVFSLRANSTGFLEVKVTPENGQDLVLSVLDSCFTTALELSCSDGAPAGGVERLSVPVLKGQTLYIAVDGFDTDQAGDFTLEARSIPQNCGDGWVASSEQCDGGQEGAKDPNCSFHCTRKLLGDSAPEGPSAVPLTAGQPVEGEIFPAGDEDLFSLTVAPGQTGLVLEMGEIDGHGCAELALDSELTLLDANGNEVASNDDAAGLGFCSRLELNDLLPGGYTVRVRSSRLFAPQQVFSYRLTATSP